MLFIDSLIHKFGLENVIGLKNSFAREKIDYVGKLLYRFVPELVEYLESNSLNHEFFTTQWIITLFSNTVKPSILFKIWDFFIIYQWKFLYMFIVSLLMYFKQSIMNCNINKMSVYIKNLLKSEVMDHSFAGIIENTFELMIKFNKWGLCI